MSAGVSYNAAVDLDFNINTEPLIRTLDADIDHSQAASGIISLGLNAGTEGFLSAVNGRNSVQGWFELRGYDTTDRCIYDYRIKCNCLGAIDPNSGDPIPVASGGITQADVLALLRASLEYQFSSDGTNWHPIQEPTDDYYRTRYPQGEWGEAISIQNGQDAPALQIKYSDDNSSWSSYGPAPTSSSFYMAQSVDGGSSWISGILFHGQDGTNGTNGVGFRTVGAYNDATIYHPYTTSGYYEVVAYDGSTYAYINDTASSGHTPPTATLIDSYWQCIAKKGASGSADNVHAEDVIGLTEFIDDTVSGNYVTSSALTDAVDDLSAAIDYDLLSYATADSVYNKESVDSKLSLKANSSDVYTKAATDNTFSTKSSLSTVSGLLQDEIDNIDNDSISAVYLNNEPCFEVSNRAYVIALAIATSMPNATDSRQTFMMYLGPTDTSSATEVGGDDRHIKGHIYERIPNPSMAPPTYIIGLTITREGVESATLTETNNAYHTATGVYPEVSIANGTSQNCEDCWVITINETTRIVSDACQGIQPWEATGWKYDNSRESVDVAMTVTESGGGGASSYVWKDISPWASNS